MTETTDTTVPGDLAVTATAAATVATLPADACDVCGHPRAIHDRIAARFCDATQAGALSRGCICRV